jgi:DNA-binding transcriptional LysR family regulator
MLARELHFGRAAALLYMSQPALSGTLKSLERELGVQLFNRSSRLVELTVAGRVFVEGARDLVATADRLVALVRESARDDSDLLLVGYSPSFNVEWLSSLLSKTNRGTEAYLSVALRSADSTRVFELLLNREIQAAFSTGRMIHPELRNEVLFREEFVVAFAPCSPLARQKEVSFKSIAAEPVIWLRRECEPWLHAAFLRACREFQYQPPVRQEVTTFLECVHFAGKSFGITFLPASIRLDAHNPPLISARLPGKGLFIESTLVCRIDSHPERLDRFRRLVREHAAGDPLLIHRSIESQAPKIKLDAA